MPMWEGVTPSLCKSHDTQYGISSVI